MSTLFLLKWPRSFSGGVTRFARFPEQDRRHARSRVKLTDTRGTPCAGGALGSSPPGPLGGRSHLPEVLPPLTAQGHHLSGVAGTLTVQSCPVVAPSPCPGPRPQAQHAVGPVQRQCRDAVFWQKGTHRYRMQMLLPQLGRKLPKSGQLLVFVCFCVSLLWLCQTRPRLTRVKQP